MSPDPEPGPLQRRVVEHRLGNGNEVVCRTVEQWFAGDSGDALARAPRRLPGFMERVSR
jgi:hypothetical protein